MSVNSGMTAFEASLFLSLLHPSQTLHLLLDQPKALVSSESYHYQYSREQNGWPAEAVHSSPVVTPFWRRKFEGNLCVCAWGGGLLSMAPIINLSLFIYLSLFSSR
jgi:hypothetical protein